MGYAKFAAAMGAFCAGYVALINAVEAALK